MMTATRRTAGQRAGVRWDEQPLGKMSDGDLASRLGVSAQVVLQARRRRGIAAFPHARAQAGITEATRRRILAQVARGTQSAYRVAEAVGMSAAGTARHLRAMTKEGLLQSEVIEDEDREFTVDNAFGHYHAVQAPRVVFYRLTPLGRRKVEAMGPVE